MITRGTVTSIIDNDGTMEVYISVPDLAIIINDFGPVETLIQDLKVGDRIVVAQVSNAAEDLLIVGRMKELVTDAEESTVGVTEYDTIADRDANAPTDQNTLAWVVATDALYYGMPGQWIQINAETLDELPTAGSPGAFLRKTTTGTEWTTLSYEPPIAAATGTGKYWAGDKSWKDLNATTVGLGNVDNTRDANKPVSSATRAELDRLEALIAADDDGDTSTGTAALYPTVLTTEDLNTVTTPGKYIPADYWNYSRTNRALNPSFEDALGSYVSASSSATVTQDTDWAASGTKSLKIVRTSGQTAVNTAAYPLGGTGATNPLTTGIFEAGKTYSVYASIRLTDQQTATTDTAARAISVGWFLPDNDTSSTAYTRATSSQALNVAGVSRVKVKFTIPSNATSAWIRLMNGGNDSYAVNWDNLAVYEGDVTEPFYFDSTTANNSSYRYSTTSQGFAVEEVNTSYATIARNYPRVISGFLTVEANADKTRVWQSYRTIFNGNSYLFQRVLLNSVWSPWKNVDATGQNPNLSDGNLNDVVVRGTYFQSASTNSTLANNYPTPYAGVLEVYTTYDDVGNLSLLQRYTSYRTGTKTGPHMYSRWRTNSTNNEWGAWISHNADEAATSVSGAVTINYVNVKDYGAKCDGVTDDRAAIQTAMNNNPRVFIPAGTTRIGAALEVPSNTELFGAGIGVTIIKVTDKASWTINGITIANRTAKGSTNIYMHDFTLDWNSSRDVTVDSGGTRCSGINIANGSYVTLERIFSKNTGLHCFDVSQGTLDYPYNEDGSYFNPTNGGRSHHVWIRQCLAENWWDDGFTTHHSDYIWIEDCYSRNPSGNGNSNGFEIDDGTTRVFMRDNKSEGCYAGIEVKAHQNAPAAQVIRIDGHFSLNDTRSYNFRHIGHGESGDSVSKSAFDIVANNLTSVTPNASKGFQDNTTPRALYIASYMNVTINNFTAIGNNDFPSGEPICVVQYMANKVNLNNFNIRNFGKAAHAAISLSGTSGQAAKQVNINNVLVHNSAQRCVYVGTNCTQINISNVQGTCSGYTGTLVVETLCAIDQVQLSNIANGTGYTKQIRINSVDYANYRAFLKAYVA